MEKLPGRDEEPQKIRFSMFLVDPDDPFLLIVPNRTEVSARVYPPKKKQSWSFWESPFLGAAAGFVAPAGSAGLSPGSWGCGWKLPSLCGEWEKNRKRKLSNVDILPPKAIKMPQVHFQVRLPALQGRRGPTRPWLCSFLGHVVDMHPLIH